MLLVSKLEKVTENIGNPYRFQIRGSYVDLVDESSKLALRLDLKSAIGTRFKRWGEHNVSLLRVTLSTFFALESFLTRGRLLRIKIIDSSMTNREISKPHTFSLTFSHQPQKQQRQPSPAPKRRFTWLRLAWGGDREHDNNNTIITSSKRTAWKNIDVKRNQAAVSSCSRQPKYSTINIRRSTAL